MAPTVAGRAAVGLLRAKTAKTIAHTSNSTATPWNTACQPTIAAATAPPNTAADCPSKPSPKTPSAVPCCAGGVQRDTNAAPIANDDPARPMKSADTSNAVKLAVIETAHD